MKNKKTSVASKISKTNTIISMKPNHPNHENSAVSSDDSNYSNDNGIGKSDEEVDDDFDDAKDYQSGDDGDDNDKRTDGFADMMNKILNQKVDHEIPLLSKRKTSIMKAMEKEEVCCKIFMESDSFNAIFS
jgi:hypothetical protein